MDRSLTVFCLVSFLLLSGCATMAPELQTPGIEAIPPSQVFADPDRHRGSKVRWGGVILAVENLADATWIQILFHPLGRSGRPITDREPEGRFLARSGRFLDPSVYGRGRELTVVGTLRGSAKRNVGERRLTLPVLEIEALKLWPKPGRVETFYPPPYWWYTPPYWPGYWYWW